MGGLSMSVGLYCRVSTEEQAASGFSIDHQQLRLKAFCESQGWNEFDLYIDDGYTGTNLNRPQMQRMIRDIEAGKIHIVLVYKLDRLSRHQKDVLYLLEDLFENYGVAFKSATEPFDTATPLGRAMIGILAVFGQLERDTIVERTKSGKSERTRQGLWYGGPVPFGYEWSSSEQMLHIIPEQAILVKSTFERFLQGYSSRSIGSWLSTKTCERKFNNHKAVTYLISNPIYTGCLQYQGKQIAGTHNAIVSQELFDLAQAEQKKRRGRRMVRRDYLLSQILYCAECGSTMIHTQTIDKRGSVPNRRGYYVCSAKHKKSASCASSWCKDETLEKSVILQLCSLKLDSIPEAPGEINDSLLEVENLKKRLSLLNKKQNKWYQTFEDGQLPTASLKEHMEELERARTIITNQIKEKRQASLTTRKDQKDISSEQNTLLAYWPWFSKNEQSNIIHIAIDRIHVKRDLTVMIEWNT
jgi:site-specific DNA recombinase